jgi:alkylated DNA repair protein (DNA oxidative demethylase)
VTTGDLFPCPPSEAESLGPGATLLHRFAANEVLTIYAEVKAVAAQAPFRRMETPGGFRMSVAMTNCGVGWITDRRSYRYDPLDPETKKPWPGIPRPLAALAAHAAKAGGYPDFEPDACLINRYEPGTRLTLHQDRNERDFAQPIVSVSLGLPAVFLWGGPKRTDRPKRMRLTSGDVVVWGGASRLFFHGIDRLLRGDDPVLGQTRINLTFRRAL